MKNQNSQFTKTTTTQTLAQCFILTLAILIAFTPESFAGTGGDAFKSIFDTLIALMTGYPAMIALAIGLGYGAIQLGQGKPAFFSWTIVAGIAIGSITALIGFMVTATA